VHNQLRSIDLKPINRFFTTKGTKDTKGRRRKEFNRETQCRVQRGAIVWPQSAAKQTPSPKLRVLCASVVKILLFRRTFVLVVCFVVSSVSLSSLGGFFQVSAELIAHSRE